MQSNCCLLKREQSRSSSLSDHIPWFFSHSGLESYASQSQEVPSSPQTNKTNSQEAAETHQKVVIKNYLRPRHHPVLFQLGNHEPSQCLTVFSKNQKWQVQNHLLRFHNKLLFVMIIPKSSVKQNNFNHFISLS